MTSRRRYGCPGQWCNLPGYHQRRYQVKISKGGGIALSEATRLEVDPVQATIDLAVSATICNTSPVLLKAPQQKGCIYA